MTAKNDKAKVPKTTLREEQVVLYLRGHPDLLKKYPDLLQVLAPPEREFGNGIVDFQHFALKNLQRDTQSLKSKYDGLVDFCRDNMSIQSQVHGAVLKLIGATGLEPLLQVITQDLAALFDVDVVRLAMESGLAGQYETYYSEQNYSGIVFIPQGTTETAFGRGRQALLVGDTQKTAVPGFSEIFEDCAGLVRSCALLRLQLAQAERSVILAFGVRVPDRFHAGQGAELLSFLASIVAHQLDRYLQEVEV